MTNAKQIALTILEREHIGVMVTNQEGRPVAKYMTFESDGFDLYTLIPDHTFTILKKTNNYTHILLGYETEGTFDTFIEYEGKFAQSDNHEVAQKLHERYPVTSEEHYTLLRITADRIRIMNKAGQNQDEIIFNDTN